MCLLPKGRDLYNISSFLSHPPQYLLWHSDAVHAPLNGKHDFFLYKSKSNYITFCLTTLVWLPYMMREAHSYSFLCSAGLHGSAGLWHHLSFIFPIMTTWLAWNIHVSAPALCRSINKRKTMFSGKHFYIGAGEMVQCCKRSLVHFPAAQTPEINARNCIN